MAGLLFSCLAETHASCKRRVAVPHRACPFGAGLVCNFLLTLT
jgi:hypothetical protein